MEIHASLRKNLRISASKSLSQRALLASGCSCGNLRFSNLSDCDDTRHLEEALEAIRESRVRSGGINFFGPGPDRSGRLLDVGEGGTTLRFSMAYAAALDNSWIKLTGSPRLLERPIQPLVDALLSMGALMKEGTLPDGRKYWEIFGNFLKGGVCHLDASLSSQFASALLLISPLYRNPLILRFTGEVASPGYLDMTVRCMQKWGKRVTRTEEGWLKSGNGRYKPDFNGWLEGDWSTASFFFEYQQLKRFSDIPVIPFTLLGLDDPKKSLQPDARALSIFQEIERASDEKIESIRAGKYGPQSCGRLTFDMAGTPDLVPALVTTLLLSDLPFRLKDVGILRLKESDRLEMLVTQWKRLGYTMRIETGNDGKVALVWNERSVVPPSETPLMETAGDHRLAMSFAVAAASDMTVRLDHASCVAKSEPRFWDLLRELGHCVEIDPETDIATIYP